MSRGTGHMVAGRLDEALRVVEEALAAYLRTGSRKSLAEYHGFLAEIHLEGGPARRRPPRGRRGPGDRRPVQQPLPGGRAAPDQGRGPPGPAPGSEAEAEACFLEVAGGRPPPVGPLLGVAGGHEPG